MPEKSTPRCLFEIVNHTLDDILTYTRSRSRYKEDNFQDDLLSGDNAPQVKVCITLWPVFL